MSKPSRTRLRPNHFMHSLTFRQAWITLVVLVILGVVSNAIMVVVEMRHMRTQVEHQVQQMFSLVQEAASEAAYQMYPQVGQQVVNGMFDYYAMEYVVLKDDFGQILARRSRLAPDDGWDIASGLFEDVIDYEWPLYHAMAHTEQGLVGHMQVRLSAPAIGNRFVDHMVFNSLMTLLRDLFIVVLVALIFYFLITRPLQRLSHAIVQASPDNPGAWPKPKLRGHKRDELGLLKNAVDRLLQAFQSGLTQRDAAQQKLVALTQELEARVSSRTRQLEQALTALQSEKAETERAFAQLDQTHADLEKSNSLILESLRYARRIQHATLPDPRTLDDVMKAVAIWWEPLHVVGGDYFWLQRYEEKAVLVVADCTGHGVPGAFITLVAASALDAVLSQGAPDSPAQLLHAVDEAVRKRLRQDRAGAPADDGLDAAICIWDPEKRTLTFAGAGIPLLYIADGTLHEVRGSRASLGYPLLADKPPTFEEHVLPVQSGMQFYMFTDGVPDHMGGRPKRLFGKRRLGEALLQNQDLPIDEQIEKLQQQLRDYRGHELRRDDVTLIGFQPL